jgi:hypothetical protein
MAWTPLVRTVRQLKRFPGSRGERRRECERGRRRESVRERMRDGKDRDNEERIDEERRRTTSCLGNLHCISHINFYAELCCNRSFLFSTALSGYHPCDTQNTPHTLYQYNTSHSLTLATSMDRATSVPVDTRISWGAPGHTPNSFTTYPPSATPAAVVPSRVGVAWGERREERAGREGEGGREKEGEKGRD